MENIEAIKNEILPKTKIFFDSIESQLIYREKHYNKYRTLNLVTILCLVLFIFNVLPVIPYFLGKLSWVQTNSIQIFTNSIPLGDFLVRWIALVLITGMIYLIFRIADKHFDKKEDKNSLSRKHINFAFIYKTIKELDIFLINERVEHAICSLEYLNKYIDRSFLYYTIKVADESLEVYLPKFLKEIKIKNNWIIFSDLTQKTLDAFGYIGNKIKERIRQRIEIDVVINVLNDLLVYEYLQLEKIKNEKITTIESDIATVSNSFLECVSDKVLNIADIEFQKKETSNISTLKRFNSIIQSIGDLFTHQYLVITFLAWLILLSAVFSALLYIGEKIYELKIDTTLFVGTISGIVIGAITISATIYSKKK